MRVVFLFFIFRFAKAAYLSSSLAEWSFLKAHTVSDQILPQHINLDQVAKQEWSKMVGRCPSLPSSPKINIKYDYDYQNTTVLAYATQNLHLSSEGVWVSSIYEAMKRNQTSSINFGYDMTIGINPYPPNGWFFHKNCTCENISYRFDLRSVIRHELLHGLILASSIRRDTFGWKVGYFFQNNPDKCYPRLYDTKIVNENGEKIVNGCNVSDIDNREVNINGIPLYHPTTYRAGSSLSHHNMYKNLMYYSMPAQMCLDIGEYEVKLLEAMNISCNLSYTLCHSNAIKKTVSIAMYLTITTLLFLF